MWENIVQSIRKVKSGDKGLGCILAHTMGLGKTFQVLLLVFLLDIPFSLLSMNNLIFTVQWASTYTVLLPL